ncbi:MAG: hypothetical protein ACYCZC_04770 [Acidithiobacillus sp.]
MKLKNSPEVIANKVIRYLDLHPGCSAAAVLLCLRTGANHVVCGQLSRANQRFLGACSMSAAFDQDCILVGHYNRDAEPGQIVEDLIWYSSRH